MNPLKKNIKSLAEKCRRFWRLSTSGLRVLPDFIIIGAQKAGTTSLYDYLCQHPQIKSAGIKEIHFFDRRFYRGMHWYRSFFPLKKTMTGGNITGEGSPAYMAVPGVAEKIASALPDVKLIVLLRDPVKRAVSSYTHQVRGGREKLSFKEALNSEEERTSKAREELRTRKWFTEKISKQFSRYSYRQKGEYVKHLKEYFKYFDRSRIFIESSDALFKDTENTVKSVLAFLGVEPEFTPPDLSAKNRTDYKKWGVEVNESAVKELREYYTPLNRELYELLERDFGWE